MVIEKQPRDLVLVDRPYDQTLLNTGGLRTCLAFQAAKQPWKTAALRAILKASEEPVEGKPPFPANWAVLRRYVENYEAGLMQDWFEADEGRPQSSPSTFR